jgi:hypothetical protein
MQEAHSIFFQTLSQWGLLGVTFLGFHLFSALRIALQATEALEKTIAQAYVVVMLSGMMGNEILLFHPFFLSAMLLAVESISARERGWHLQRDAMALNRAQSVAA